MSVNLTMNNHSKLQRIAAGSLLSLTLLVPFVTFADTTSTTPGQGACARISDFNAKLDQNIVDRQSKLDAKKQERLDTLTKHRNDADGKLEGGRTRADENRALHYEKLGTRAKTDAEKQAVANFKAAVEAAVAAP